MFAAPRTALENSYLAAAMRDSGRELDGKGAWVDFNSLNYDGCWVTGGANATCPYSDSEGVYAEMKKMDILVSSASLLARSERLDVGLFADVNRSPR